MTTFKSERLASSAQQQHRRTLPARIPSAGMTASNWEHLLQTRDPQHRQWCLRLGLPLSRIPIAPMSDETTPSVTNRFPHTGHDVRASSSSQAGISPPSAAGGGMPADSRTLAAVAPHSSAPGSSSACGEIRPVAGVERDGAGTGSM